MMILYNRVDCKGKTVKYLYETHLHTAQSSACARTYGADYIQAYKELGYTGIIVTDHFYNSNTDVKKELPWREWVERFCEGYEDAKAEGDKQGLDVFFGWEETFVDDDYLVYGLDKAWLLEHPEAARWTRKQQYEAVKKNGGCVVQAHPFRQHYYIQEIYLETDYVDAVEVANAGNMRDSFDALAKRYADRLGLPGTAGSDIHNADQVRSGRVFGVYLDRKLESIHDYVKAIRENRLELQVFPADRCGWRGNETISLPVEISGEDGAKLDIWDFLREGKRKKKI
jgi:hypothetical protein